MKKHFILGVSCFHVLLESGDRSQSNIAVMIAQDSEGKNNKKYTKIYFWAFFDRPPMWSSFGWNQASLALSALTRHDCRSCRGPFSFLSKASFSLSGLKICRLQVSRPNLFNYLWRAITCSEIQAILNRGKNLGDACGIVHFMVLEYYRERPSFCQNKHWKNFFQNKH